MSLAESFFNSDRSLLAASEIKPSAFVDRLSESPARSSRSAATAIVFIDANVSDAATLMAGVQPGTEVHLLDRGNAIEQITQTLLGRSGIESLQIVSHGGSGGVQLGEDWLNVQSLPRFAGWLQSWGQALTDSADILLYGCDVGQGAAGREFVDRLAQVTGADVAASDDLTGNRAFGGDWELEVSTGRIEATLPWRWDVLSTYADILPLTEQSKLTASDGAASDCFGISVAISGNTAIVGSYLDDDKGTDSGSAYIYQFNGTSWVQQSKLTASDGAASDFFGYSVAISGNTAIVGSYLDDDKGTNSGSAYIYQFNGTSWVQQSKLTASDGAASDYFGYSVAISGNTAIVGSYLDDDLGTDSGSAYIHQFNGTSWVQQSKLTASDGAAFDRFGYSVAISGNTAIVGSYLDDDKGTNSGSAYIHQFNGTSWVQQSKLTASDGAASDFFGYSVAISGNTAIVGSYFDDDKGTDSGSAYIYQFNGTSWVQQSKLTASDGAASDFFGYSVAISGNTAIVGSYFDDDKGTDSGSAYIYQFNGTSWVQQSKLTASDGAAFDRFGYSVAISGNTAIVGSYLDDNPGTANSGSAYIFADSLPTLSLATTTPNLTEGSAGSFTLSRGTATTGDLTVNLTLDSSSTVSSSDYTLRQGATQLTGTTFSVTIPDGASSVVLTLDAILESLSSAEAAELLKLNLATGTGYTIGSTNTATVTIDQNGFIVINTTDNGEGSLRQAILNANAIAGTDTITFAGSTFTDATADTITLTTGEFLVNGSVTIEGTGTTRLFVNGNNASGIFNVVVGDSTVNNLTLQNGSTTGSGGAILFTSSGILSVNQVAFSNNRSTSGGGAIGAFGGRFDIRNSTFTNNRSDSNGGAIILTGSGASTITNSTFSGNRAVNTTNNVAGGAIYNVTTLSIANSTFSGNSASANTGIGAAGGAIFNGGALTLSNNTISGNTSTGDGGGIRTSGTSTLNNNTISGNTSARDGGGIWTVGTSTLTNNTISSNTSTGDGGGIRIFGTSTLNNNTISGNTSTGDGGGIWTFATLTLTNNTISGNTSANDGGGILTVGTSTLTNNTITNNTADADNNGSGAGGGIIQLGGTVTLRNTLIAGNFDTPNNTGTNATTPDISGTFTDGGFNLIGKSDGSTDFTNGTNGNIVGTIAAPINPGLAPLANNGGSTRTHALLSTSAARNAGSNALLPADTSDLDNDGDTTEAIPFDQRGAGNPRILGGQVDIGAFELANIPPTLTLPGATTLSYTENGTPILLDGGATVSDDAPDLGGGSLTVSFSANGTAEDRLAIQNQGTGAGQIGVSGSNVTFEGTAIGTFTGGIGTTPLIISLNSNATLAATQALLRNLTFANISENPNTSARTVSLILNDGSLSTTQTKTINVTAVDDTEFFVTNTADNGIGSLRQAVLDANADPGAETIRFTGAVFTDATADTITLTTGQLLGSSDFTLNGTGANLLTISGNNASRVFQISSGTVSINNLAIANGNSGSAEGGGIFNFATLTLTNAILRNNIGRLGGGLINVGNVALNNVTVSSNRATEGGGINNNNNGVMTITNSTISGNTSSGAGGGIINLGLAANPTSLTITNSTISGNTSPWGGGLLNYGLRAIAAITNSTISGNTSSGTAGGIGNDSDSTLSLLNATIANNTASSGGGGISRGSGTVNIKNTLIANNTHATSPDVRGVFVNQGNNLISRGDGSTDFTNGANGNIVGTIAAPVNAFLAPLANNGGSTQTYSLLPGSPAINSGTSTGAPAQDQRGITRTGAIDIGALELQNVAPVIVLSSGTVNYIENATPLLLDPTAIITDADNPPNFNTGVLTVSFSANGTADDRLAIQNQGTGAGQIGISGSAITFGGTAIATFTGGIGTTNLAITFNTNATIAAVEALLRNLTYVNVSETPSTLDRSVSFVMTDGAGGTSTTQTKTVSVTAVDDITVLTVSGNLNYLENGTLLVASGLTLSDLDGASETLDAAQVLITANLNPTQDRLGIQGQSGTTSGTINGLNWQYDTIAGILIFSGTANLATYQSALRQVVYTNLSDNPSTPVRNLQFNITPTKRYYEFVSNSLTWTQARDAAAARTRQGMAGYLATITSAAENAQIQSLLMGNRGWISANDAATEGIWRWMTGPEGGRPFWSATSGVLNGSYINWNSGEPNNWGGNEDHAEIISPGSWNDILETTGRGYIVEYGGGDVQQTGNVAVNVIRVNDAPSFTAVNQRTRLGQQVIPLSLWTRNFNLGPEETDQSIDNFIFTNSNPGMFTEFRFESDGTLVFTASNALLTPTTATINVRVRDDGGTANGGINESTIQTFTITVVPPPRIVIENVSRAEGNSGTTSFDFNVSLSHQSLDPVTVRYGTEDMSARVADRDYASTFGSLSFAPGELRKAVTVRVIGDTKAEPIEQFLVRLNSPTNGTIQSGIAIGTIFTDDSGSWIGSSSATATSFVAPLLSSPTTTSLAALRSSSPTAPTPVNLLRIPNLTLPSIVTVPPISSLSNSTNLLQQNPNPVKKTVSIDDDSTVV
ncbi:MAG: DUF4347 domain-containing protein [Plectolyngbya sp. WJT66-NPBG17]|jgi:hypothetical protein|nr:DUF4347 domain-containing protein [Plectolyngbya sp. WJT66-NPBG17]